MAIAVCAARGPGIIWPRARERLYVVSSIRLPSSTRSLRIYPTSAAGPPKPMVPSFRKYRTNCPRLGGDAGIDIFCAIADRPLAAMQGYAFATGPAPDRHLRDHAILGHVVPGRLR